MKLSEIWGDKKKKGIIYIVLILGVLFLFVGSFEKPTQKEEVTVQVSPTVDTKEKLEQELEEILEKIEGVGEVDVMLSYEDSGQKILGTDVRTSEESRETQTVMKSEGGATIPFVVEEKLPSIKGIIIVAEGANNKTVEEKLKKAAAAVLDVYPHNIAVYGGN